MKATAGIGKAGRFPVRGMVVNLESADIRPLVNAAALAVKVIVAAGAVAIGMKFFSKLYSDAIQEESSTTIGSLARINENDRRKFIGLPLDEDFPFRCQGQELSVNIGFIKLIKNTGAIYSLELVDGSSYLNIAPKISALTFLTLAGIQKIDLLTPSPSIENLGPAYLKALRETVECTMGYGGVITDRPLTIDGITPTDITDLRLRLRHAIENTRESVIAAIGEDIFSHFFK